jgi:hypothetical protein
MFIRKCLGMAALAVSSGVAAAQPALLPPATIAAPAGAVVSFNLEPPPPNANAVPAIETNGIGVPGRFWASGEWLYWATSGQPLPVLATASPVGTAASLACVPGSPNTATLFGGDRVNKDFRSGYRLNAGWWFDDCRTCGIEGDFFFLQNSRNGFATASNGSQIISRPFFNALTGRPDAALVSFPGIVGGSLTADVRNSIIGGGVNTIHNLCGSPCGRLDFLVGYRYWNVADEVNIRDNATALPGSAAGFPGTNLQTSDHFGTSNNFHGGLVGLSGEKRFSRWFVGGRTTIAFGANIQSIDIGGSTLIAPPGGPATAIGSGLYAQPSNIGHYNRTVFAVVPEIGVRTGVQITDHARVFVGYNFLYMSNVVRAGDQIDTRVPATSFVPKTTDFWAQGVSIGAELRY